MNSKTIVFTVVFLLLVLLFPLNNIFAAICAATGNVAWSIVLLTFLIKLAFMPIQVLAGKSAKKMAQNEPINPLTSIVPALISIPVFWSLFQVFKESSLTVADPFFLLPTIACIVFGVSLMYGPSSHKVSKKMVVGLTSVFGLFMFKMPAAVLIYTITSSSFSMAEKYIVNKFFC
jgi:YidC/Oxa1 family membrane protein insertase